MVTKTKYVINGKEEEYNTPGTYIKAIQNVLGTVDIEATLDTGSLSAEELTTDKLYECLTFDEREDPSWTPPTKEELAAEYNSLKADYEAKDYQRARAEAYPSLGEQLDKIYHEGVDAWKADIQAIKDQFPKPE
jgi:hypothetical protein